MGQRRGRLLAMLHFAAPPVLGGVETTLAHHAQLLSADGYRVRIVCGRGQAWDPSIEVRRVRLVDSRSPEVEAARANLEAGRVPRNFETLASRLEVRLEGLLRECGLVIAHNIGSLHKNLVLTAALNRLWQRHAIPRLILWHHDFSWTSPQHQSRMHEGYPWDLLRRDWAGCMHVVVSNARRDDLRSLVSVPDDRLRVIPPGIETDEVLGLSQATRDFLTHAGLRDARPLLFLPARITPRKNIELALHILRDLRTTLPAAKLLVTGPLGPHSSTNRAYADELRALRGRLGLEEGVVFAFEFHPEGLPAETLFEIYRVADGLLLTSHEEGFGIPVLEAAIHTLPVFLSDLPPLRAIAGEEGVFFGVREDTHAIAQRIADRLQGDPRYRLRSRVAEEFTWEGIYREHILPLVEER
jgi:glycosyltransferase involved in cell wall biosynthesis